MEKEIVIEIGDKLYDLIKHYERSIEIIEEENDTLEIALMRAIIKGTPLPKGHGRIIDADALYDNTKPCHTEEDGTACVEWREINDAPTIIEADKAESEDKE